MHTCFAFFPNTKSIASMTFDLPLPLGPTTEEKHCNIQILQSHTKAAAV